MFQFKLEEFPLFFLVQLTQITALIGTLLLSWSMLIMTRLNFLERLFDGLDKVYKTHKNVSIWGHDNNYATYSYLGHSKGSKFQQCYKNLFPCT